MENSSGSENEMIPECILAAYEQLAYIIVCDMRAIKKLLKGNLASGRTVHCISSERHRELQRTLGSMTRKWFGHVLRAKGTPANGFLQGKVEGKRSRGRLSKTVVGCKGMDRAELKRDVE